LGKTRAFTVLMNFNALCRFAQGGGHNLAVKRPSQAGLSAARAGQAGLKIV
jgi:hypothetical protein